MTRRLLTLLATISLLASAAALIAWHRSYRKFGSARVYVTGDVWCVSWPVGQIALVRYASLRPPPPGGYELAESPAVSLEQTYRPKQAVNLQAVYHSFAGFGWVRDYTASIGDPTGAVFAPAWFVAMAGAAFPAWWLSGCSSILPPLGRSAP